MSIQFREATVRIWPEAPVPDPAYDDDMPDLVIDLTARPSVTLKTCGECGSTALYYTPKGLCCTFHAWEAASDQDPANPDFWIPVLIDR